jgi:outer membrane protein TolC
MTTPILTRLSSVCGPRAVPGARGWLAALAIAGVSVAFAPSHAFAQNRVITLDEALSIAQKSSPDFKLSDAQVERAAATVQKAWTAIQPTINATGSYTYSSFEAKLDQSASAKSQLVVVNEIANLANTAGLPLSSDFAAGKAQLEQAAQAPPVIISGRDQVRAGLAVNVPIFQGAAWPALQIAWTQEEAMKLNSDLRRETLFLTVTQLYYSTLAVKKAIAVSENAVQRAKETLELTTARFDAGLVPKLNLIQSRIDLEVSENELSTRRIAYEKSKEGLASIMNFNEPYDVAEPAAPEAETRNADDLYSEAIAKRLDVKSSNLQLKIAEKYESVYWWTFAPTLSGSFNLNWTNFAGFAGNNTTWQIGLALVIPLYDGGQRYANLRDARGQQAEAKANLDKIQRDLRRQIREAQLDVDTTRTNAASAAKQQELATEQHKIVAERYEVGLATGYDVSEANRLLRNADANRVIADLNLELAQVRLKKVTLLPVGASSVGATSATGSASTAGSSAAAQSTSTTGAATGATSGSAGAGMGGASGMGF